MGAGTALRQDYDAETLRDLAKRSNDAKQTRRLLALAVIYEGGRRTQAAKIGGVTLQVIRDWVLRFNAQGPGGLIDRKVRIRAGPRDWFVRARTGGFMMVAGDVQAAC